MRDDQTEDIRRSRLVTINGVVESRNEYTERKRLEALHGKVWNTATYNRRIFDWRGHRKPQKVFSLRHGIFQ